VHPDAGLTSLIAVARSDLQGAEEAQFQREAVPRGELGHLGDVVGVLLGIRHEAAWRVLTRAVLLEEVVEGDEQGPLAGGLSPLADGAEAVLSLVEGEGEVEDGVRISGQRLQLGIADEDNGLLAKLEREGTGVAHKLAYVQVFGY